MAMNTETFVRGFVAKLIDSGASGVRPHAPEDRGGFQRIVDLLDNEIARTKEEGTPDRNWYMQLVRLRNDLQASNTGAFDTFETALRDLQLSLTASPNPFYEEIAFTVSKPFAGSLFSELPPPERDLVARAAQAFLEARAESL